MTVVRTRRIWHAEVAAVCEALEAAGAWQTALRVRTAHRHALSRRPEGTAFDYRPTVEDAGALADALGALRTHRDASPPLLSGNRGSPAS